MDVDVRTRAELAAGILHVDGRRLDRALGPSTVLQSGYLPPDLQGDTAHGEDLARWAPPGALAPQEAERLAASWSAALPPLGRGMRGYLRVRVDTPADVRHLRAVGEVDGLEIAPSLGARSTRPLAWRWPFRLSVVPGQYANAWVDVARQSEHHTYVFDAEPFVPWQTYDIAIVDAAALRALPPDARDRLAATTCVIAVGAGPVDVILAELESVVGPAVAVAVDAHPDRWWRTFCHELSHDVPIDVAVERIVRDHHVDALVAGPRRGMDITASAHWFAAVAPGFPQLAPLLEEFARWDWRYESGGSRRETHEVRQVRAGGEDPVATVSPPVAAPPPPTTDEPEAPPRRLVARVFDGDQVVTAILSPESDLVLAVRVAIPERTDVTAGGPAIAVPPAPGPTAELEVAVSGAVWERQPAAQQISLSRVRAEQPSSWAVFPFTTPFAGGLVSIDVTVSYRGKPLQAATYVSPVRDGAVPGERPQLTTYRLSGPDEPTDNLRPVDVTLDGRGAEMRRRDGDDAVVPLGDVQDVLDTIEDRVSRVLGVPGAPASFDDPRALALLVLLAQQGAALGTHLEPLRIGDARSINVIVNADTRVLPLELVYAGPAPADNAKPCTHVTGTPPAPGTPCTKASVRRVCPYAFWGSPPFDRAHRPLGAAQDEGPAAVDDDGLRGPRPIRGDGDRRQRSAGAPPQRQRPHRSAGLLPSSDACNELDGVASGRALRPAEPASRARAHDARARRPEPLHRTGVGARAVPHHRVGAARRRSPATARAPHRLRDRSAGRRVRDAARDADRQGRRIRRRHAVEDHRSAWRRRHHPPAPRRARARRDRRQRRRRRPAGRRRVVLLSPTAAKLRTLSTKWEKIVTKAGLVPGAGADGLSASPPPHQKVVDPLPVPLDLAAIARLAAKNASDRSVANGACIAFVVEHGGERVLLGADAHAPVLAAGLERYAARVGEARPRFELVKLAHHGSNANLSVAMLELIDCRRFLVSTNGDNFAHPDDVAIAKVIAAHGDGVTFFCNYRTTRTGPWAEHGPDVGATFTFPRPGKDVLRVAA